MKHDQVGTWVDTVLFHEGSDLNEANWQELSCMKKGSRLVVYLDVPLEVRINGLGSMGYFTYL